MTDCPWIFVEGRLHCPKCSAPDYPPLDPKTGKPRWFVPEDSTKWPHRNCLVQPEPRPEEEQAALVEVCKTCPLRIDEADWWWCDLDRGVGTCNTSRKNAFTRRLQTKDSEMCGPWEVLEWKVVLK